MPFYLVLLYLFLEYGRPQNIIAGLADLHMSLITASLITLSLLFSGRLTLSDKQTKLSVLLLSLMIFHIPLATNNFWSLQIARGMLVTFIAYLGIITFVDSVNKFKMLIYIWLGIHVYLAITGIEKGGRGIGGFLGDENDFSMTLNMIIPFAFFMALAETHKLKSLLYIGLAALFLFANVLTLSRGGFIGMVAVGFYCWLKSPKKIVSAVLLTLLVLVGFQLAPKTYWERIRSIQQGTSDSTGADRVYIWKIGWTMFLDHPVLGVGQGNFPYVFREYEVAAGNYEGLHGRSRAGMVAHSIYFTLFPELGIVGVLIFAGLLYYMNKDLRYIRELRRITSRKISVASALPAVSEDRAWPVRARGLGASEKQRHRTAGSRIGSSATQDPTIDYAFYLSLAMTASLIGFLISGIFISILYYPNFWILMGFIVALKRVTPLADSHERGSTASTQRTKRARGGDVGSCNR
jgi:O-antigen ligase